MNLRQHPFSIALRQMLFGSATLLLCHSALGQTTAPAADGTTSDPESANAEIVETQTTAPAADGSTPTELGKIIVTAQNRSQEVQQVPISLQIVTAQQIDTLAATDLSKMALFVPGLVIDADQPTQPSYQLRGIKTRDFGVGTESSVGVYVDGVYAARSGGSLLAFNDIQRIEVLKGPQGTLFGRNAAAGAISIITNEPSDHFEAKGRVRFGNDDKFVNGDRRYGDALVNIPLNKDMALRVSVVDIQSNGWVKDAATGRHFGKDDEYGTRTAWRWDVTPDTRVLLSWDHEKLNQTPRPTFGLIARSSYVENPAQSGRLVAPFPADPASFLDPRHAPLFNDAVGGAETRRFDGSTLNIDHAFGWGSLISTTAWRNFDSFNRDDFDGTNNINTFLDTTNIEDNNSWYQEFKLAGNTDIADWVAGVSYYQEHARQTSQTNLFTDSIDSLALNLGIPTGTPDGTIYHFFDSLLGDFGLPYRLLGDPWREAISNEGHFKAYAAYGDVIWHLSDRLNLTTGIRYTRDQKRFSWFNAPRFAPQLDETIDALDASGFLALVGASPSDFRQNLIFTDAVGVPVIFDNTWNDFSPRLVLNYTFTPDTMVYASVTKGYKAGGFNSVQVGSKFAPEKVYNYEAGIKTVFPEQNLLFNATGYYYRFDNRQSLTLDPNSAGSRVPRFVVNSTDQEAYGAEVELQWQPNSAIRLGLNGSYIDATFRNATARSGTILDGQTTGEPKYSFAATAAYTWYNVANGELEFDLSHAYRSKSLCNSDSQLQGTCDVSPNFSAREAQNRTDARLDWRSAGDRWAAALYVTNAFNHRYLDVNNITQGVFGTPFAAVTPPRIWGLELRTKF